MSTAENIENKVEEAVQPTVDAVEKKVDEVADQAQATGEEAVNDATEAKDEVVKAAGASTEEKKSIFKKFVAKLKSLVSSIN